MNFPIVWSIPGFTISEKPAPAIRSLTSGCAVHVSKTLASRSIASAMIHILSGSGFLSDEGDEERHLEALVGADGVPAARIELEGRACREGVLLAFVDDGRLAVEGK